MLRAFLASAFACICWVGAARAQSCGPYAYVQTKRFDGPTPNGYLGIRGIALDGATAVISSAGTSGYEVYVRQNETWSMQATLPVTGYCIDLDGDVIAIGNHFSYGAGSSGYVDVYRRTGGSWALEQHLTLVPAQSGAQFGSSVAIADDFLAVGVPHFDPIPDNYDDWFGRVDVFRYSGGTWSRVAMLDNYQDYYVGRMVTITKRSPTEVLVFSNSFNGWRWTGGSFWSQEFVSSLGPAGPWSIESQGDALVVGEPGAVWLYRETSPSQWTPTTTYVASDAVTFGSAVALTNGKLVAPGQYTDAFGLEHSAAYLFDIASPGPTECQKLTIAESEQQTWNYPPLRVSVSGDSVLFGVPIADHGSVPAGGCVYSFNIGDPAVTYCTAGTSSAGCSALIHASGTPSASLATPFVITGSNVDGARTGLIFYGITGASGVPWGTTASYACVQPPRQRTAITSSGGTAGACDGTLLLDWNSFASSSPTAMGQPWTAGARVYAQCWYRDPAQPIGSAMSNALAFVLRP